MLVIQARQLHIRQFLHPRKDNTKLHSVSALGRGTGHFKLSTPHPYILFDIIQSGP